MALTSAQSPSNAIRLAEEVYEVVLSNFGNRGTSQGTAAALQNIAYPAGPGDEKLPAIVGMAISPRSQIDRAFLLFNPNPTGRIPPIQASLIDLSGVVPSYAQEISIDRPWAGQLDGPVTIRSLDSTWYNDSYLPSGQTAVADFGTALASTIFAPPELRLLLFTRGLPAQPTRRTPLNVNVNLTPAGAGDAAETLMKVIPVHGRRHIRVMARNRTSGVGSEATIRVGGVVPARTGATISAPIITTPEAEVIPVSSLALGECEKVTLSDPQIQFLTVYVGRTGGGSGGGITLLVEALD